MHPQDIPGNPGQQLAETVESVRKSATSACDSLCQETSRLASCASARIRENPLPAVLGAAAFGAAVCYLILSNRQEPCFREKYLDDPLADAGEGVSTCLRDLYANLKFW